MKKVEKLVLKDALYGMQLEAANRFQYRKQ